MKVYKQARDRMNNIANKGGPITTQMKPSLVPRLSPLSRESLGMRLDETNTMMTYKQ